MLACDYAVIDFNDGIFLRGIADASRIDDSEALPNLVIRDMGMPEQKDVRLLLLGVLNYLKIGRASCRERV